MRGGARILARARAVCRACAVGCVMQVDTVLLMRLGTIDAALAPCVRVCE